MRGPRILKQLEEATYSELERNTMQFAPPSEERQHSMGPIQVQQLELIPYTQSNALGVRGQINSSGNKYQSIILFMDVEFQEEDTNENITFTAVDGNEYHALPINLQQNNVKVRCTCLDFRWRFSIYNDKAGVLYGEGPGVYVKKTDRPPNNPKGVPGLCKHLLKLAVELKNSGVIRP